MTMPTDGGMIKLVNVGSHDPLGSPRMHLLLSRESMAKMASADLDSTMDLSVMPDELAQFWHDCDPDFDKHVYTHINIVSAFEYYGPNNNGDSFPEQNIYYDGYYRTFTNAHPFLLHNNSDPKLSIGKVIATGYNLKMHRIEVISRLDKDISKSIEIIARIRSGKFPDVSMGCVPKGSMILSSDGQYVPIETISSGDKVITHRGVPKSVTTTMVRKHRGNIHHIKVYGNRDPLILTDEHPLLVLRSDQILCKPSSNDINRGRRQQVCTPDSPFIKSGCVSCKTQIKYRPEWIRADEVDIGDRLLTPVPTFDAARKFSVDESRLLGYYLAEGCPLYTKAGTPMAVQFCTGLHETSIHQEILSLAERMGFTSVTERDIEERNGKYITIYDRSFTELCIEHCGVGSTSKTLSSSIMGAEEESLQEFLGAYANGDGGCYQGSIYLSTASFQLAKQLQIILLRCMMISSVNVIVHKPGPRSLVRKQTIEYQIWIGTDTAYRLHRSSHILGRSKTINNKRFFSMIDDVLYLITPVEENEVVPYDDDVYNFAVSDDESYLLDGIAVHNCRVPYDVCSICGKKAKTRAEYCDHAKNHLLQFHPYNDMANRGRITCVHNTKPTFFDQSFVFTRADKGTNVIQELNKAAGIGTTVYFTGFSADAGALFFKEAAKSKEAEIEKASPEDITADVSVESKDKKESEGYQDAITPELPMETCEALASHPFEDIFDTAGLMGMHVMPKEYAVIDALKSGDKPRAIVIKKHVTIMLSPKMASVKNVPMRRVAYNYKVAQLLAPFLPVRSFLPRFDLTRQKTASMEKVAHGAPMVSSDYAKHVVATFMNTDWQNEFYKRADLVVACQSRIKEYAEGSYNDKEDPKIAAVRLGGAYKSFEGLRPIGK
ncbi:MAG: hypothetical protein WC455_09780 [Dehalococcoidia bacterium]